MPPPPFSSLLVVCTGNICRSPMGEVLLRERLRPLGEFTVASAGTGALVGHGASEHAIAVMDEKQMDLRTHRGRQFDLDIARDYDLALVMESEHRRWIEQRFPVLRGRVRLLGQWLDETEIPDPFGRSLPEFRESRDLIERAVDTWVARLARNAEPRLESLS
jgi:protein-tyrosine phosphatase